MSAVTLEGIVGDGLFHGILTAFGRTQGQATPIDRVFVDKGVWSITCDLSDPRAFWRALGEIEDDRVGCAECGAPWGLPEAGQCYLHPCTRAERDRWLSVTHGMDMNQRARHASGWRAARLFLADQGRA